MGDAVVMLVGGPMLAYTGLGEPAGPVMMYFHGAPTSRLDLEQDPYVLVARGRHTGGHPGYRFVLLPGQGHVSLLREIPQLCADLLTPSKGATR
jgi:hypothetical protein